MEKKNAFTLIELIAVITLLALIVLVSVPVLINTLGNTEQKQYEDFKKLVTNAAELYIERNRNLYPELNEVGGAVDITADVLVEEEYLKRDLENPVNNKSVSDYKLVISVNENNIFDYVIYERNKLVDLATISPIDDVKDIHECALKNSCEIGTPFIIKVNNTDTYKFYVISDDGDKVVLLMNKNLYSATDENKGNVPWISSQDYNLLNADGVKNCDQSVCSDEGPITALTILQSRTSSWTNLPKIEINKFEDNKGNEYIMDKTFTTHARLIKWVELKTIVSQSFSYENLYNTGDTNTVGYWTSSFISDTPIYAFDMHYKGQTNGRDVTVKGSSGLRPVIEISRY